MDLSTRLKAGLSFDKIYLYFSEKNTHVRERFKHVKWQSRICNLKHLFEFTFSCNTRWGLVAAKKRGNIKTTMEQGVSLLNSKRVDCQM